MASKIGQKSKYWSNEKRPSPLNAYGYKYFSLLLFYKDVVPADLSQRAKSATADGLKSYSPFIYMTAVNFQMIPQLLNCYDKHTNSSSSK
jgi:hypothetical protein